MTPAGSSNDSARNCQALIGTFSANSATTLTPLVPQVPTFIGGLNRGSTSTCPLVAPVPSSFDDGELNESQWFIPLWTPPQQSGNGEFVNKTTQGKTEEIAVGFEAHNVLDNIELDETDGYEYHWKNPCSEWHACQFGNFFWQGIKTADNVWYGTAPFWPPSRQTALGVSYHHEAVNYVRDIQQVAINKAQNWDSGEPPLTIDAQTLSEGDYKPALHYVRLDPVYTRLGAMKLNAKIVVEYQMELEVEEWEFPVQQEYEMVSGTSINMNESMARAQWNILINPFHNTGASANDFYHIDV